MFFKVNLCDAKGRPRGNVDVQLDWEKRTWLVTQDPMGLWSKLSRSQTGKFQFDSSNSMTFLDELRQNPLQFLNPPKSYFDLTGSGQGWVFQPIDPSLAQAKINWSVEQGTQVAPAPAGASDIREKLIARLRELLPCSIDGTEKDARTKLTKWDAVSLFCKRFSGTSCGSLPGFVSAYLGAEPLKNGKKSGLDAYNEYMKKRSLNGTNKVREQGNKFGAWVEGGGPTRPKKGDIYALLDRDAQGQPYTDKKTSSIGHVGVILDATGDYWMTADLGQGNGFEGKFDIRRHYDKDKNMLYGEVHQGGVSPYRVVAGWVDIERYFQPEQK